MTGRCVESEAGGAYRFLALPAGEYAVALTLPGFEPSTCERVRVGLGETTSVPVTIDVARQCAYVTVEGQRAGVAMDAGDAVAPGPLLPATMSFNARIIVSRQNSAWTSVAISWLAPLSGIPNAHSRFLVRAQ